MRPTPPSDAPLLDDAHPCHHLQHGDHPYRSYRIRWWLLFLVSAIAGGQGGIWITYGVLAPAVKPLFPEWNDGTIALLSNWGPIMYLCAAWPTSWVLDVLGLRVSAIFGSVLVVAGGIARCAHYQTDSTGSMLAHLGQILNGLAGPVAMSISPVLSAVWFPPHERNAATAIASTTNYGGTAVVFALGSVCVPAGLPEADARGRLWRFMLGELIFSVVLLVLVVCTFPAKPPSAPSRSATVQRASPAEGLKLLARCPAFWMLACSYAAISGVFTGWGSLLPDLLQDVPPASQAEADAGLLGSLGALAGMVGGVALGHLADRLHASRGRRKALLLGTCAAGGALFLAFLFAVTPSWLPPSWVSAARARRICMFVAAVLGSLCANAVTPLFYELAVEATYPVAEGLTTTALTLLQNVACGLFLLQPTLLPGLDGRVLTLVLVAACVTSSLVLLPLREPRRRLAIDTEAEGREASTMAPLAVAAQHVLQVQEAGQASRTRCSQCDG
jgi:FLVCR family MFS transporter